MLAIVRLDGGGQGIGGEVSAETGFYVLRERVGKQGDVARVAGGVGTDAVRAAVKQGSRGKEFVFIDQLDASGEEVAAADGRDGFKEIRI